MLTAAIARSPSTYISSSSFFAIQYTWEFHLNLLLCIVYICVCACISFWLISLYLWMALVFLFSKIYYGFTHLRHHMSWHYTSRHLATNHGIGLQWGSFHVHTSSIQHLFWANFCHQILFYSINHTMDFCIEKLAPKLPDFEEFLFWNCQIWLIPLVDDHQLWLHHKIERKKKPCIHPTWWVLVNSGHHSRTAFFFPLTAEISPKTKQKLNYIPICVWMNPPIQPTFWSFLSEWIYECKKYIVIGVWMNPRM